MLLTELPTYMKNVLHYDMKSKAVLAGLPYFVMWGVSIGASATVDKVSDISRQQTLVLSLDHRDEAHVDHQRAKAGQHSGHYGACPLSAW